MQEADYHPGAGLSRQTRRFPQDEPCRRNDRYAVVSHRLLLFLLEEVKKTFGVLKNIYLPLQKDIDQEDMMIRSAWWWRYSRIQNS